MIEKLNRVHLRDVWKHEAHDFTTWLEDNIDVLNEVLDFNLVSAEREKAAGDFSVDLVGEDENGNTVIIENQLEKSDHDHLGKVLTYLAALEAKAAVWIVAQPRAEHIRAVSWLNEATSTPFYLVQLQAVRIGNSAPAALMTLIVGPSDIAKEFGKVKKELSERHQTRLQFWEGLLEAAKPKTTLHSKVSPSKENWIGAGAGRSGISFEYIARQHETQVRLQFNTGDSELNSRLFAALEKQKAAIESMFGAPLQWDDTEGKNTCKIAYDLTGGGYRDEELWPQTFDHTIDAMIRLEEAMRGPLKALKSIA